jgi:6-pyruvoyltetrahydropterin/6-carboxytetrahydropterin synthase
MTRLTRRYRFSASHRLYSPQLDEAANQATYGKCANPYGHGHNYVLELCVEGPIDRETGRIADPRDLDAVVDAALLPSLNNANLNDLAAFSEAVPTTENLAAFAERTLRRHWPQSLPHLRGVRILETARNSSETSGVRS